MEIRVFHYLHSYWVSNAIYDKTDCYLDTVPLVDYTEEELKKAREIALCFAVSDYVKEWLAGEYEGYEHENEYEEWDNDIKEAFREELHRVGRQHEREGQTILQRIFRRREGMNF